MRIRNKVLLILVCLLAILFCVSIASADEATTVDSGDCGENGNNVAWTLYGDGKLSINGTGKMKGNLNQASPWNNYLRSITSVEIGSGVTGIGSYAFSDCTGLTEITIPDSVTEIGERVFNGCSSLTEITVPSGVTEIGDGTFFGCSSLTSITIPSGVTSISDAMFYGCSGLTSITIPAIATYIGENAFYGCSGLTSITIPSGVTEIGVSAFGNCGSLTDIVVDADNANYSAQDGVLFDKSKSILLCYPAGKNGAYSIPNGVTVISDGAFTGCSGLTEITIPDGVTVIGAGVFDNCTSLTMIEIPDSVTSIFGLLYENCSPTIVCGFNSCAIECAEEDGIRLALKGECGDQGDNVIGILYDDGMLVISGDGTMADFDDEENLEPWYYYRDFVKSVEIGSDVTSIGSYAFYDCEGLKQITIPSKVTSIGSYAFCQCYMLDEFTIPDGVISIGDGAFCECIYLESITIPDSVESIGTDVFAECSDLTISCSCTSYAAQWAWGIDFPTELTHPGTTLFHNYTEPDPGKPYENLGYYHVVHCRVMRAEFCTECSEKIGDEPTVLVESAAYTVPHWDGGNGRCGDCGAEILACSHESTWQDIWYDFDEIESSEAGCVYVNAKKMASVFCSICGEFIETITLEENVEHVEPHQIGIYGNACDVCGYESACAHENLHTVDMKDEEGGFIACEKIDAQKHRFNGYYTIWKVCDDCGAILPDWTNEWRSYEEPHNFRGNVCVDCGFVCAHEGAAVTDAAVPATCARTGLTAGSHCAVCGIVLTAQGIVPMLDHDIEHYDAKEATCTQVGWEAYDACKYCNYTTYVEIPALDHDRVPHEAQAPTCTEIGWDAYETCSRCEYSTYVEIPATEHTVVVDPYIPPTRTTSGKTAGSHCSKCGKILEEQELVAPLTEAPLVELPDAVIEIAEEAYLNSGVECVILPDGCMKIDTKAFASCASLKIIEIPASVTDIAADAFENSLNFVIVTTSGTAAETFAKQHGFDCLILHQ